jgi:DNA polymerase III sliding clamp (beta) subunit (PCNA family)
MKFSVNAKEFSMVLGSPVDVANRNVAKGFKYEGQITMDALPQELKLYAFGGGASIVTTVSGATSAMANYQCEEAGKVTVEANNLIAAMGTFPNETLLFEISDNELKISLVSSPEYVRCLATLPTHVETPRRGSVLDNKVTINKDIFAKSFNNVAFAVCQEENLYQYQCVALEISKSRVRFVSGSGGRFVVNCLKSLPDGYLSYDKEGSIFFPKLNISNVKKFLSEASCTDVVISLWKADEKIAASHQLTIECGGSILAVYDADKYDGYPDMDRVLKHSYSNAIYSNLQDWRYAINGSLMTREADANRIHNTEVKFDKKKKRFMVESKTQHKSKTPVGIVDDPDNLISDKNLWFRCNTDFFKDMISQSDKKDGKILISFETQENLAGMTDEAEMKKIMKPVLVSYPEGGSKDTYKEEFYMFFTVSTKE